MARYQTDFYAKSLARRITMSLIVPSLNLNETLSNKDKDYYQKRKEEFPLIIFLCGFGDNQKAWINNSNVESLCEKYKVAAAFIDGENGWYLNNGPISNYYGFIEDDITDFIYGNFRNVTRNKPLVIAGVSMGGYGALYHYLTNVNKYAACIAFSPATKPDFIDESKIGTLESHFLKQKGKKLNIYLSIGENDFIIEPSREFNNILKKNKVGVEYKFVPEKNHSWDLWKEEIYPAFEYLQKLNIIGE